MVSKTLDIKQLKTKEYSSCSQGQPAQAASSPVGLSPCGVHPEPCQASWMRRPGCWFCWTCLAWPRPRLQPTAGLCLQSRAGAGGRGTEPVYTVTLCDLHLRTPIWDQDRDEPDVPSGVREDPELSLLTRAPWPQKRLLDEASPARDLGLENVWRCLCIQAAHAEVAELERHHPLQWGITFLHGSEPMTSRHGREYGPSRCPSPQLCPRSLHENNGLGVPSGSWCGHQLPVGKFCCLFWFLVKLCSERCWEEGALKWNLFIFKFFLPERVSPVFLSFPSHLILPVRHFHPHHRSESFP